MDDRQVLLLRGHDDKAPVHTVGVEIVPVVQLGGNLRREAGHVDIECLKRRRLQAKTGQRLVLARDEMRLLRSSADDHR